MQVLRLASETDFEGWRGAARTLRARGVQPQDVLWTVDGELFGVAAAEPSRDTPLRGSVERTIFSVPREFLELAEAVVLHRSDERFDLLYRLLWRLSSEPHLLRVASDPDVAKTSTRRRTR
jgi:DNA polymerase